MKKLLIILKKMCILQRLINKLEYKTLIADFKTCGDNFHIRNNHNIYAPQNISIGSNVSVGENAVIYALAPISIGDFVMISPNVTIISGEHRTDLIGEYMGKIRNDERLPENDKPIVIEDDCWIGSNAIILKGTTIGRGSIIHAGAIVSGKIKPYTVYISKDMKMPRFTDEEIAEHEKLLNEKYGVTYPPIKERRKGR